MKKKVPKSNSYKEGDPRRLAEIKKGDPLPEGAVMGAAPGAGIHPSGRILDENGKIVGYYHIPQTAPSAEQTPSPPEQSANTQTQNTATPAAPVQANQPVTAVTPVPAQPVVPAPAVPAPVVKAPTRQEQRDAFKKALDAWQGGSAQKVPTEIANEIQNNIRTNVQAKQAILDAAAAKKYGTKSGPVKGQQLTYDEAAAALGGKDVYDDFLNDIYGYEAYRAKTKGTYDTQNVTWGATDPNEKMYGFRMSNMFKNSPEQSAANVKKTPANVLEWQKNPTLSGNPPGKLLDTKTILLDNNNEAIPEIKYDAEGKPIIPKVEKPISAFKKGGKIPKGYKKTQKKADGGGVEPDLSSLTPEQQMQFNQLLTPQQQDAFLQSLSANATGAVGVGKAAGDIATTANDAKGAMANLPYSAVGNVAGTAVDKAIDVDPDNNRGLMIKDATSMALKRAGTGAAIGSSFGPIGTMVGGGLGLVEGAVEGTIKGKKKGKAYDEKVLSDNIDAAQGAQYSLAEGGPIEGPGTAKSDSIKAEIKAGSFVVPAENAAAAERIRKMYLRDSDKAKLKQPGGTDVKLSDGEHLFTPEEYKILSARGIDLNKLAPNQEGGRYGLQKGGPVPEYKDGGGVDEITALIAQAEKQKAAQAAKQKADDEKHEKEKEAGRVSAIEESNYLKQKAARDAASAELDKWVGIVKSGMKPDGSYDSSSFTEATGDLSSDLAKLKAAKAKYDTAFGVEKTAAVQVPFDGVFDATKRNAITGDANAPSAKKPASSTSDTTTPAYTQVGDKWVDQNGKEVAAPKPAGAKPAGTTGTGGGAEKNTEIDRAFQAAFLKEHDGTAPAAETGKQATSTDTIANLKVQYDAAETLADVTRIREQMHELGYNSDGTLIMAPGAREAISGLSADGSPTAGVNAAAEAAAADGSAAEAPKPSAVRRVYESLGEASGLLAIGQIGAGAWMGMKDKMPVDKVDPNLQAATQKAMQAATFGFTPEQKAYQTNQVESNRRDVVGNISQMSGGNVGMALANTRMATIDANQANLGIESADAQLKQQKQGYADNLTSKVADANRRIFTDSLSRYMLNQQAAGNLMQAGFSNLSGAMTMQNQQDRMDERAKKWPSDPWQAIIAQQQQSATL